MKNISVDTIAAPPIVDPEIGPLTLEHRQEFALARRRAKSIHKAAAVASLNAWATAVVAIFSMPFSVFSWEAMVLTTGLVFAAANEFRGRRRLLQFDPAAASILGWNQLVLLAVILGYCSWSIYTSMFIVASVAAPLQSLAGINSHGDPFQGIDTIVEHLILLVYGVVIVLSVVFQGLTALYYFTRRKYVETYLAETPAWIRELQRTTHPA